LSQIERFVVVTGGPGSGKTSLISALAAEGLRAMPEAGRAIIQDQVAIDGNALPWADRAAFAELMLAWDLRSYREARGLDGLVLFDRGIPDVIGYLQLCGLTVPEPTRKAAALRRYRAQVFIAPPWPAIYAGDAERKQSLEEAQATHEAMLRVYASLGYELVSLPLLPVAERAAFMLRELGQGA
jgi:predicted ATPase